MRAAYHAMKLTGCLAVLFVVLHFAGGGLEHH